MAAPELALSHFGLYVFDLPTMERFYTELLGFVVTDRGLNRGREILFMSRDPSDHHQIVMVPGRTGSRDDQVINQLSFRVESLDAVKAFNALLKDRTDVSEIRPVSHGNAWSVYFRDPENNRLEVFTDSPWYVTQPRGDALDLTLSNDEIARQTEAACRTDPGFMPVAKWQAEFKQRLAAAKH
ncbi:MAG: VOC family protein [Proteobacteria bacterium]|nr:VOC family protein [Pseudomonadota bacterium]